MLTVRGEYGVNSTVKVYAVGESGRIGVKALETVLETARLLSLMPEALPQGESSRRRSRVCGNRTRC